MTKLNLINEKDLTKAISSLLYNDTFSYTPENLRDINFVKENKEEIAKALILQSLKKQCREWLASIYEKNPHSLPFEEVTESDIKDIKWAQDAINNGGSVHKYITDKNFPDDVVDNLTKARDFLYQRAIETVDKQIQDAEQRPKNKKNIINLSALLSQYKSLDLILEGADKWHQEIAERAAQEAQKEADLKKALEGTEFLMDLPDGLKAYRLLTPEALDYESSKMGHCVGSGGYDSDVKAGTTKIYSLRDKKGEPHVTFEVRMNNDTEEMHQCKGKENKAPVVKYLQAVQTFIREKKFKIKADLKNTGLLYLDGEYYDLFNLPEGLVIKGDLDVSGYNFEELPACFSKIKVKGSFNCSGCYNLKSLKNAPQSVGGKIITTNTPLIHLNNQYYDINNLPEGLVIKGDLDVSGYNFEELPACFSKIKVEGSFKCSGCSNLKSLKNAPQSVGGDFDCSRCSNLSSLKGAPQSVGGDFDCSNCYFLSSLEGAPQSVGGDFDCSNCSNLSSLKGAPQSVGGDFDCSNCYFLSSLEGAPQYVGGDFDCSDCDNLTSLEGAPQSVGGDFDCSNCYRLSSLKNIPILKGKIKYKNTNITVFSKLFYSIRNKINVLKEKNSKRKTGKIKEVLQKLSSKNETIKKETIHTDMPKETMIQKPVLNTKQNRTATSTKTTTLLSLLHNRRNIR
ncbi:MAG: PcfJ domain-containing protein [Alphaproteobacteria bacterium]|nr:PcfJ domain-containing protein [Alphaproteobacteria bacterium]